MSEWPLQFFLKVAIFLTLSPASTRSASTQTGSDRLKTLGFFFRHHERLSSYPGDLEHNLRRHNKNKRRFETSDRVERSFLPGELLEAKNCFEWLLFRRSVTSRLEADRPSFLAGAESPAARHKRLKETCNLKITLDARTLKRAHTRTRARLPPSYLSLSRTHSHISCTIFLFLDSSISLAHYSHTHSLSFIIYFFLFLPLPFTFADTHVHSLKHSRTLTHLHTRSYLLKSG